jgi:hypothetical protein
MMFVAAGTLPLLKRPAMKLRMPESEILDLVRSFATNAPQLVTVLLIDAPYCCTTEKSSVVARLLYGESLPKRVTKASICAASVA